MLLSGALFALFMTGIWLYCLTDAILTPVGEFRGLSKPAWIAVIAVTLLAGALAWLITRRPVGRAMAGDPLAIPRGPDDDPDFLRTLSRAIDGDPPAADEGLAQLTPA